jgi:hypothetical protein
MNEAKIEKKMLSVKLKEIWHHIGNIIQYQTKKSVLDSRDTDQRQSVCLPGTGPWIG